MPTDQDVPVAIICFTDGRFCKPPPGVDGAADAPPPEGAAGFTPQWVSSASIRVITASRNSRNGSNLAFDMVQWCLSTSIMQWCKIINLVVAARKGTLWRTSALQRQPMTVCRPSHIWWTALRRLPSSRFRFSESFCAYLEAKWPCPAVGSSIPPD